jgi:hypothetical protein
VASLAVPHGMPLRQAISLAAVPIWVDAHTANFETEQVPNDGMPGFVIRCDYAVFHVSRRWPLSIGGASFVF